MNIVTSGGKSYWLEANKMSNEEKEALTNSTLTMPVSGNGAIENLKSDDFLTMALESLNADSKVWGTNSFEHQSCIYVSAKSAVKEEILDKSIWKQYSPYKDGPFEIGYKTYADGLLVTILFMKPKRSVFDLVASVGQPVRNLEGFQVSPPNKTWDMPKTVSWSPLEINYGGDLPSPYDPNDEIPF